MGEMTIETAVVIAVIGFIMVFFVALIYVLRVNPLQLFSGMLHGITHASSKFISKHEERYHRDLEVGKINEKTKRAMIYRFMNDLIIDLGLKRRGATPYEFLAFIIVLCLCISFGGCKIILNSFAMGFVMMIPITTAVVCALYTKANLAHDARIEAVIESENIISNNIKDGVIVAVRNSIDMMPAVVRSEFKDFLDNIEHKNFHIRTALLELNNNLGSISDEFIKKCIVFEMEEEHGVAGMFRDIVEINNIKTELRNDMKHKFEEVIGEFVIGSLMIFAFLGGVLIIYPNIREFYFHHWAGNLLIAADALILVGEFVFITYLKAKDL